jgi:hypothetical protein
VVALATETDYDTGFDEDPVKKSKPASIPSGYSGEGFCDQTAIGCDETVEQGLSVIPGSFLAQFILRSAHPTSLAFFLLSRVVADKAR